MAAFDPTLQPSDDRGHLLTEQSNPRSRQLDELTTADLVNLFVEEDRRPQEAVAGASAALTAAVDAISERLLGGGRLFYLGAGTSGRLGVLDAAECPRCPCQRQTKARERASLNHRSNLERSLSPTQGTMQLQR